jgi:chemotaxis protein histidine kinase CheA
MIGQISTAKDFGRLAGYLERGVDGADPADRVRWARTRNLMAETISEAAEEMANLASINERIEKPAYHLIVSFAPEDRPSGEMMETVAERLLEDLGLERHQALLVAHKDTPHDHVHIMVNRVSLWRDRAANLSYAYRQVERSMRRQELENGLRLVEGLSYELEEDLTPEEIETIMDTHRRSRRREQEEIREKEESLGRGQPEREREAARERAARDQRMENARGELSLSGEALDRVRHALASSGSWGKLQRRLEREGLRLVVRRRSLQVVGDGGRSAPVARLARGASLHRLERRFGAPWPGGPGEGRPWGIVREGAGENDRSEEGSGRARERAIRDPSAQEQAIQEAYDALRALSAAEADRETEAALRRRVVRLEKAFAREIADLEALQAADRGVDEAFAALYRDPARARRAFDAESAARGPEAAWKRLGRAPEEYGALEKGWLSRRPADPRAAHRAIEQSQRLEGGLWAREMTLRELRATAPEAMTVESAAAPREAQEAQRAQEAARGRQLSVPGDGEAWARAYRDPEAARRRFERAAQGVGDEAAVGALADRPETYGRLRWGGRRRAEALAAELTLGPGEAGLDGTRPPGTDPPGTDLPGMDLPGAAARGEATTEEAYRLALGVRAARKALAEHLAHAPRHGRPIEEMARSVERRVGALGLEGRQVLALKVRNGGLAKSLGRSGRQVAAKIAWGTGVRLAEEALGKEMGIGF